MNGWSNGSQAVSLALNAAKVITTHSSVPRMMAFATNAAVTSSSAGPMTIPPTVKNRLKAYHTQTAPLINYYKELGKVAIVDGEAPIEDVSRQIDDVFSENATG